MRSAAMKMNFICENAQITNDKRVEIGKGEDCLSMSKSSQSALDAKATAMDTSLYKNPEFGLEKDVLTAQKHSLDDLSKKRSHETTKDAESEPAQSQLHTKNVINTIQDPVSEYEFSEDEEDEIAAWENVDFEPAIDLISKIMNASLEAGKSYNKSILAKTTQLITGFDNILLEIKSLSDARDGSRKNGGITRNAQELGCDCEVALDMLSSSVVSQKKLANASANESKASRKDINDAMKVSEFMEDQTDRVLLKAEASMERLREIAESIQSTSMQCEANLISKVRLEENALESMNHAIQSVARDAVALAIAQERGRVSKTYISRRFSPLQLKRMEDWYRLYPRPLSDELTLMRTILNYRPFANPFQPNGLTVVQIRDWYKQRRFRERMGFVKLAIESGQDAIAAEEEIDYRIEKRISELRKMVDPNELVYEVDKVRTESSLYDNLVTSFTSAQKMESYIAASYGMSINSDQYAVHQSAGSSFMRSKRQRTQETDSDGVRVVKYATLQEVKALQTRIRDLLAQPRKAVSMHGLQQVVEILRSLEIPHQVRVETNLVADLKMTLKSYRKPSSLRKSTIALLEKWGFTRRQTTDNKVEAEIVPAPVRRENPVAAFSAIVPKPAPLARRVDKGKVIRPMKFSMKQVVALEGWFQEKYKPSQTEMEGYLTLLNSPPLREEKQTTDFSMTQLRRWFNKRRCLRRPPFALMSDKEGSANVKPIVPDRNEPEEVEELTGKSTAEENDSEDNQSAYNGEDA